MSDRPYLNKLLKNIQESADQTAIDISKTAAEKGVAVYNEKVKNCKPGMFKRPKEDPRVCQLKAMRSSARTAVAALKERVGRCKTADNPVSCRRSIAALVRQYEQNIQKFTYAIEDA